MSDENPNRNLTGFLKNLTGVITSVIGLVTGIAGFVNFAIGNRGTITLTLLAIGISAFEIGFLYIYFKKVTRKIRLPFPDNDKVEEKKGAAYSDRIRRLALIGAILIPLISVTVLVGWKYLHRPHSNKIIVLVSNFEGPDAGNYRVTDLIMSALREATKKYPEVEVRHLNQSITEQQGNEEAHKVGEAQGASLFLWGWYGRGAGNVLVTTHFEVLTGPKDLPSKSERRMLNAAVAELESFKIQTQLSEEMTYLTLMTIGLVRLEANDFNGAIERFTDALNQISTSKELINLAPIYYFRGNGYLFNNDYDRAIPDYNEAIRLKIKEPDAYYNRSIAFNIKGDYDRAIADCDEAIKLKPDDPYFYFSRGYASLKKGDYDRTIADYDKVISLKSDYAPAYNNRGIAFNSKGDYDRAIADYDEAIRLKP